MKSDSPEPDGFEIISNEGKKNGIKMFSWLTFTLVQEHFSQLNIISGLEICV